MLWWEKTDGAVNPQAITIILTLFSALITHGGGLPVSKLF